MYDLKIWFLLFIFYSFVGWIIEIINVSFIEKKLVNRGFLIGPYCPVYGIGAVLMLLILNKYVKDPKVVFGMGILICGTLEYLTSYIMEKLFKARWWDYSKNKFNLNGRICLLNLILFGIGGVILICFVNPTILNIVKLLPEIILNIVVLTILILFLSDLCISFKIIFEFKNLASSIRKDSTEEIKERVKSILKAKSIFSRRLINSFPNLQLRLKQYTNKRKKIAK